MDSFWWGLMVLTTVGYGSTAPTTAMGKVSMVLTRVGYGSTAPTTAIEKVSMVLTTVGWAR